MVENLILKNSECVLDKPDKVILTSYSTKILDFMENVLGERKIKYLRLDGKTCPKERQLLVNKFNDGSVDTFVFLLGAKAGGTGLNFVGANKMVMMDIDWNPSNERQVMGRIYRQGMLI